MKQINRERIFQFRPVVPEPIQYIQTKISSCYISIDKKDKMAREKSHSFDLRNLK